MNVLVTQHLTVAFEKQSKLTMNSLKIRENSRRLAVSNHSTVKFPRTKLPNSCFYRL